MKIRPGNFQPLKLTLGLFMGIGLSSFSWGAEPDLLSLSLEEILNVQITSVSRKSQRLTDSAAAAFVLTNEDIRRSGATSIPEALRMVPGLDVARLGSNRWAVSSRGFNGRFANKLLVQVDGRSIYSKLFSGVFWEAEDVMLEDVERIEVIRGPGAALWGANAVNGVVNIITRKAKATQGGLLAVHAGSEERGGVAVRHGSQADEDTHYRVWAKTFVSGPSVDATGQRTNDIGHSFRGGFRLDKETGSGSNFSLIGNAYDFSAGETLLQPNLLAPYITPVELEQKITGANLLGRREWSLADGSQAQLQAYIDHSSLRANAVINEKRTTVDVDFQYRLPVGSSQDLIWGLGYRWAEDSIDTNWVMLNITPQKQTSQLASAFVHDEITLVPNRWKLMLGAKLEHNSYTGTEIQPNVRVAWTPTATDTLWAAVSRGVRTPSRAERDSTVDYYVIPPFTSQNPGPLPVLSRVLSNRDLVSEKLLAYELGYRTQLGSHLSVDAALFYNRYKDLRSATTLGSVLSFVPVPHVIGQSFTDNKMAANTYGMEVSADWHPTNWWRLQGAYTYLNIKADRNDDPANDVPSAALEGANPEYQLSLRSSMNVGNNRQFDVWVRHVSKLPAISIPSYTTVDMRYAWRVRKDLELSLVGQNLLDPHHPEFVSDNMPTRNVEIQRGVYVKAVWQF